MSKWIDAEVRDPRFDKEVLTRQTELMCNLFLALPIVSIVAAILLLAMLWGNFDPMLARIWVGLIVFTYLFVAPLIIIYLRRIPFEKRYDSKARLLAIVLAVCEGVSWGSTAFLLFPQDSHFHQMALVAFTVGTAAITAVTNTSFRPTFFIQLVCILTPISVVLLAMPQWHYKVVSICVLFYMLLLIYFHRYIYHSIVESIYLQLGLREQKEKAEDAKKTQMQFYAAASHDLRQPLHAYGLLVDSLEREAGTARSKAILNSMRTSTRGMREMLDTVLDISKLDAGIYLPQLQALKVGPLLDRLFIEYEHYASSKGMKFAIHCSNVALFTDRLFLERILRNLISNAITHSGGKSILLAVRFRKEGKVRFEVRDSGVGIAQEFHHRVFTEFSQLPNQQSSPQSGLGLGLAISKRLVELLGSKLYLRSESGRGSCFAFELPILQSAESEDKTQREVSEVDSLTGKKVWVLDDDPGALAAIKFLLESWHCEVRIFSDPALLHSEVGAAAVLPDLFIFDYRLKVTTGVEMAKEISKVADIPVMLVTGDTTEEELHDIWNSQLKTLYKPVPPEELLDNIRRLVAD